MIPRRSTLCTKLSVLSKAHNSILHTRFLPQFPLQPSLSTRHCVSAIKTIFYSNTFSSFFLPYLLPPHPLPHGTINILHIPSKLLRYHSNYISLFKIDYILLTCLWKPPTIWTIAILCKLIDYHTGYKASKRKDVGNDPWFDSTTPRLCFFSSSLSPSVFPFAHSIASPLNPSPTWLFIGKRHLVHGKLAQATWLLKAEGISWPQASQMLTRVS